MKAVTARATSYLVVLALTTGYVAKLRGRRPLPWTLAALVIPLLPLMALCAIPSLLRKEAEEEEEEEVDFDWGDPEAESGEKAHQRATTANRQDSSKVS